jgi:SAM-dependent methyltransferase
MSSFAGVAKIVRFNWPWYAAAVLVNVVAVVALRSGALIGATRTLAWIALAAADVWLVASLAVSHFVYDRSAVASGDWLAAVNPGSVRRAAVFHGGLNEAEAAVARFLPASDVTAFDFYDGARVGSPSLERARSEAESAGARIAPDKIPLEAGSLDLGLVVFAAHEIRRADDRAAFFGEMARVLAPSGRLLVVEHLRDVWNLLAFGPGAFHFFPEAAWLRAFAAGRLRLLRQTPCTRFVRVFELARAA